MAAMAERVGGSSTKRAVHGGASTMVSTPPPAAPAQGKRTSTSASNTSSKSSSSKSSSRKSSSSKSTSSKSASIAPADDSTTPALSVTTVKNFFKCGCQRYLALSQALRAAAAPGAPGADAAGFDPALAEAGQHQEESVLQLLDTWLQASQRHGTNGSSGGGGRIHNPTGAAPCSWDAHVLPALPALIAAGSPAVWREVALPEGGVAPPELGVRLTGRVDFLVLSFDECGEGEGSAASADAAEEGPYPPPVATSKRSSTGKRPVLVVVECKSSQQPDTSHYVQLACYRLALRSLLRDAVRTLPSHPALRCALVTASSLPHARRRVIRRPDAVGAQCDAGAGALAAEAEGAALQGDPVVSARAAIAWVRSQVAAAEGADDGIVTQMEADVIQQLRHGGSAHRALLAGARERAGGVRTRAAAAAAVPDLKDLPFAFGAHCDSCPSNESSECGRRCEARGAVQLAGCSAVAAVALAAQGVRDLEGLAGVEVGGEAPGGGDTGGSALPGMQRYVTRARLLLQRKREGDARPLQQQPGAAEVVLHQPAEISGALPPVAAGLARAYLVCEYDAITQRMAAVAVHCAVDGDDSGSSDSSSDSSSSSSSSSSSDSKGASQPLQAPLQREPGSLVWSSQGARASTFVRCAPEAYTIAGTSGAAAAANSSAAAAALTAAHDRQRQQQQQQQQQPEAASAAGALSCSKDDMREALLIAEAFERLLAAAALHGGADKLHVFVWGAAEPRRLAARCYALLTSPAIGRAARLVQALRGLVLLLGGRGPLAGLPHAAEGEQRMVSSLQQELATRYTTHHLRPGLVDAVALAWAPHGRRFAWRRSMRLHGRSGATEVDLSGMLRIGAGHAASQIAPAMLSAYWFARQQQQQDLQAGAPFTLPEPYQPHAAAAAPGQLEAFLTAKAEALAHLERSMRSLGGCNPTILKPPLPSLVTLAAGGGADAARAACAEQWAALGAPWGLVRAALDAVRLDRGGAADDWMADACKPLSERVGAVRSALLHLVPAGAALGGDVLFVGTLGLPDHSIPDHSSSRGSRRGGGSHSADAAASGAAAAAVRTSDSSHQQPLPFSKGDFVRVTGLFARDLQTVLQDGFGSFAGATKPHATTNGSNRSSVRSWLESRGANCRVSDVQRDPETGTTTFTLAPAYIRQPNNRGSVARNSHYHLPPIRPPNAFGYDFAVLDACTSDYVGCAVDAALCEVLSEESLEPQRAAPAARSSVHAAAWLALLQGPSAGCGGSGAGAPAPGMDTQAAAAVLSAARWPIGSTTTSSSTTSTSSSSTSSSPPEPEGCLQRDQLEAVLKGAPHPIQLIQGPPGTGKTEALAAAMSAALLLQPGCARIGVVSHTHSAIDNVVARFVERRGAYGAAAAEVLGPAAAQRLDVPVARMAGKERWMGGGLRRYEPEVKRFDANYIPVW